MIVEDLVLRLKGATDRSASRMGGKLDGLYKGAALATAALLATGAALGSLTLATAAQADENIKAARAAGISVEAYTELGLAFELAGVSASAGETAMRSLARTAFDAQRGSAEAADAYAALGVTVDDGNGNLKRADLLLAEVLDALGGLEDKTLRAALSQRILGRSGTQMATLIEGGSDALKAAREQARQYGVVISEDAAKASEELNDTMTRLRARGDGLRLTFGLRLVPVFQRLADKAHEFLDAGMPFAFKLADKAATGFSKTLDFLETPLGKVVGGIAGLGAGAGAAKGLQALFQAAKGSRLLGGAFTLLGGISGALVAKLALIGAVIGGVVLLADDLWTFISGGDSKDTVTGAFFEWLGVGEEARKMLVGMVDIGKELWGVLGDIASTVAGSIADSKAFQVVWEAISAAMESIGGFLSGAGSAVLGTFTEWVKAGATAAPDAAAALREARGVDTSEAVGRAVGGTAAGQPAARGGPAQIVNVTVHAANMTPDEMARAVERGMEPTLQAGALQASG